MVCIFPPIRVRFGLQLVGITAIRCLRVSTFSSSTFAWLFVHLCYRIFLSVSKNLSKVNDTFPPIAILLGAGLFSNYCFGIHFFAKGTLAVKSISKTQSDTYVASNAVFPVEIYFLQLRDMQIMNSAEANKVNCSSAAS